MNTENPLESLKDTLSLDSRDWANNKTDAWIYGIVNGWGDCYEEVGKKYNWSTEDIERLKRLHVAFFHLNKT